MICVWFSYWNLVELDEIGEWLLYHPPKRKQELFYDFSIERQVKGVVATFNPGPGFLDVVSKELAKVFHGGFWVVVVLAQVNLSIVVNQGNGWVVRLEHGSFAGLDGELIFYFELWYSHFETS